VERCGRTVLRHAVYRKYEMAKYRDPFIRLPFSLEQFL